MQHAGPRSLAPAETRLPCARVARRTVLMAALATTAGLPGCARERPIQLGLLVGLSGHDVPNAEDGRNGAILAVEQRNAAGGVQGRELVLIVQDDGPDPAQARAAVDRLMMLGVVAIVGPFGSSAVHAILPRTNAARLLVLSPTASESQLVGRDDYLVRLGPDTRESARAFARVLYRRGRRRVALAVAQNPRGATYARGWRDAFVASFRALGGQTVAELAYAENVGGAMSEVVRSLLARRPDGLVFIGGTVDAARLTQQARKQAPSLPVAVSESAANASLIELGGRAVEGVLTARLLDVAATSARYLWFQAAYRGRFGHAPGDHAMAAYDAVGILAEALARQRDGESAKDAVLRNSPYQGVQQPLVLDLFGDVTRALHFAVVRNGQFEALP